MPRPPAARGSRRRPTEISAGGVVARPGSSGWEFALVRAGRYWGLPKGRVETGEAAVEAALREISEECGIPRDALTGIGPLPASEYVYRREGRLVFKRVHHFLVVTGPCQPLARQESEIDEAEWLSPEVAHERASFADTRSALTAAAEMLARHGP